MSPVLQHLTEWKGISVSMPAFSLPVLFMLPVVIRLGCSRKKKIQDAPLVPADWIFYLWISYGIIETHLFSQYVSSGISGGTASFALTIYKITTIISAVMASFNVRN